MKENKIRIYSYSKVWKTENRIYAIQNIILPAPIKPQEIIYFLIVAGVVFILSIIPIIALIPTIIRFLVIPYVVTQFLLKKKLDGKMPQKYAVDYVKYLLSFRVYVERFKSYTDSPNESIKLDWICSARRT